MAERVRIEIGFDGGQVMSALVETDGCGRARAGARRGGRRHAAARRRGRPLHGRARANRLRQAIFARRPRRFQRRLGYGLDRASAGHSLGDGCRNDDALSTATAGDRTCGARRAGAGGRSRRAGGAVPPPLRPHLQLPAHDRRQPARRRGPDDADVPADARVDRPVPLAVGSVLRVAVPDRAQPRDRPLPGAAALAAGGGGAGAARGGGVVGGGAGAGLARRRQGCST